MKHRLICEGIEALTSKDFQVEIQMVNNLLDFDNINMDGSVQFLLPAEGTNQIIFKLANKMQTRQDVKEINAIYLHGGREYYNGKLLIQQFNRTQYKCVFVANGAALEFGDKNLRDAPWPDIPRAEISVVEEIPPVDQQTPDNSPFCFPMFKAAAYKDDEVAFDTLFNKWDLNLPGYADDAIFSPWVYYKRLLGDFAQFYGYTVAGTYFESPIGNKICYPTNTLMDGEKAEPGMVISDAQDGFLSHDDYPKNVLFSDEDIDNYNVHDGSTGIMKIEYPGVYTVNVNGLQIEVVRDPNPLTGSEVYFGLIELVCRGIVVDQQPFFGITSNGNSITNHFISLSATFIATVADLGEEIFVLMSYSSDHTRVKARWRSGEFTATFTPTIVTDPFIPFSKFVPNRTFTDVLSTLQQIHPLQISFNPVQKVINVDLAIFADSKTKMAQDWTEYAHQDYEGSFVTNGFTLNYNYEEEEINSLPPQDQLTLIGFINRPQEIDSYFPSSKTDAIYCRLNNHLYKAKVKNAFGTLQMLDAGEVTYPIVLGSGETEIKPDIRPVSMYVDDRIAQPEIKGEFHSEFYNSSPPDFDLQIAMFHFLQTGKTFDGLFRPYPFASAGNINHQGDEIFPTSLYWQDIVSSMYLEYYAKTLPFLVEERTIKRNFRLPANTLYRLDISIEVIVEYVRYQIRTINYSLKETGVGEASVELVKVARTGNAVAQSEIPPDIRRTWDLTNLLWNNAFIKWN